jgi:hypothetical protein
LLCEGDGKMEEERWSMKKVMLWLVVQTVVFCFSVPCWAIDLNAGGQKKGDVKSEIMRGCETMLEMGQRSNSSDFQSLIKNFNFVFSRNIREDTASPGFLLGANYMSFIYCYSVWANAKDSDQRDRLRDWMKRYFTEFRKIATQMKIEDTIITQMCGPTSAQEMINKWELKD